MLLNCIQFELSDWPVAFWTPRRLAFFSWISSGSEIKSWDMRICYMILGHTRSGKSICSTLISEKMAVFDSWADQNYIMRHGNLLHDSWTHTERKEYMFNFILRTKMAVCLIHERPRCWKMNLDKLWHFYQICCFFLIENLISRLCFCRFED